MPAQIRRSCRVITVLNLKGGVGKTHTAWLIASVCQERSLRVLLIDTDTQGNLSNSFVDAGRSAPGVEQLFHPGTEIGAESLVRRTSFPNIDLIPSSPVLARHDLSDQRAWEAADSHLSLVEPLAELRPRYDYIVIDCPPRLSLVSFSALCATDAVIIPMEAADWGAQGVMQVTEAIHYVRQRFNPHLQLAGYLVSRFKRARSYQQTYLRQLREYFGGLAFDTVIPDLAQFEQSVTDRIPITLFAPGGAAAGIARNFFDELHVRSERVAGGSAAGRRAGLRQRTAAAA